MKAIKQVISLSPYILAGLLLLNFIMRLVVLFRPYEYIDAAAMPDDAYLSLQIARNIANGLGPLYGFEFTNGFQPLYVFMMVPVYMILGSDMYTPIYTALVVLIIFDTLTLFLVLKLSSLFVKNKLTLFVIAIAWIVNPYVIRNTLNGLETMIAVFFIMLSFYYYFTGLRSGSSDDKRSYFIFGLILGAAMFSRVDNILLIAAFYIVIGVGFIRNKKLKDYSLLLRTAAGIALVMLPWLIYSYHYTGDLYPISGRAVRFLSISTYEQTDIQEVFTLKRSVMAILTNNLAFIFLIVISFTFLVLRQIKNIKAVVFTFVKRFFPLILFLILLFSAYTFYIYTHWFFPRYYFPFVLFFIFALGYLFDNLVNSRSSRVRNGFAILFITVIIIINLTRVSFSELYFDKPDKNFGYSKIGLWVKENLPPGSVIGAPQSGAIGYFAESMQVVNLDGVVNKSCYNSLVNKKAIEYIKENKIQFVVGWELNINFLRKNSSSLKPGDLVQEQSLKDWTTWGVNWEVYKVNY